MEKIDVSDSIYLTEDELIKRIHKTLNESNVERKKNQTQSDSQGKTAEVKLEAGDNKPTAGPTNKQVGGEEDRPKGGETQLASKYETYANSIRYFEKLNGQLQKIKQTVAEDSMKPAAGDHSDEEFSSIKMKLAKVNDRLKPTPKTIHTTSTSSSPQDNDSGSQGEHSVHGEGMKGAASEKSNVKRKHTKEADEDDEEILFRDADDFAILDEGSEMTKDKDSESEKVFITKKEKRYLEDIGNLASRTRVPLDEKHQRFFEKDRKKFDLKVEMPETQEIDKKDAIPKEIIKSTKEIPVNITSTELDGLKGYLLQLKELIARRETAWARTTERDYSQRVEITRFKNEVSHLRMLCDKRTRELREKDHIIQSKDEEIKELNRKINQLKTAYAKMEKREVENRRLIDAMAAEDSTPPEAPPAEPKPVKKTPIITKPGTAPSNPKPAPPNPFFQFGVVKNRDLPYKKPKEKTKEKRDPSPEKALEKKPSNPKTQRKMKSTVLQQAMNDEIHVKAIEKKMNNMAKTVEDRSSLSSPKESEVDEKLQKMEEILHEEVLRATEAKKKPTWKPTGKLPNNTFYKGMDYLEGRPLPRRGSTSGSQLRTGIDVLGVLTGTSPGSANAPKRSRVIAKTQGPASIFQNSFFPSTAYNPMR